VSAAFNLGTAELAAQAAGENAPAKRCRCTGAESPECHDNTCVFAGHEGGYCIQCEDEDDPERAYESDDDD
jgi:hypothetical protein